MIAIQYEEVLEPDTILPVQFHHIWHGTRTITPERALLLAVLWQAAEDLRQHRHARRPKFRRLYQKAYQWVASQDRSWPFSFLNACDVLGLSPQSLRAKWLNTDVPAAYKAA